MFKIRPCAFLLLLTLWLFVFSSGASAQVPKGNVFFGYSYGNADLTSPIAGYQKQSRFDAGGLVGYDFGPIKLQAYASTDVVEHNYGGRGTRGWFRMSIPLWTPAPQQTPLITKG